MAQFRDILFTGLAFGMPAYLLFRSRRFDVVLGAVAFWLLVFLCGQISSGSMPDAAHRAAVEEWMMNGWALGLVYCSFLWLFKQAFLLFRRGLLLYRHQRQTAHPFGPIWHELNQPVRG